MSELVAFLEARLAEDEAVAKKAAHLKVAGPLIDWHPDSAFLVRNDALDPAERAHIARHDPARVLREVTAKRKILAWHPRVGDKRRGHCYLCSDDHHYVQYPCDTVRALAAVYSDHPDFQEQWR